MKTNKELIAFITPQSDQITIDDFDDTWYVIESEWFSLNSKPRQLFLLEHERYGDETPCLIVDSYGNVIMDDVYNGFDDYIEDGGEYYRY